MLEKELYPLLHSWLRQQGYYCGDEQHNDRDASPSRWVDIGPKRNRLDVVGVKSIGGQFYDALELVGIEVKRTEKVSVKDINQALGYGRYVDRAYLASPGGFRDKVIHEAARYGLGLLTLEPDKKKRKVRVVLTAGVAQPHPEQRAELLKRLWVRQCRLCGVFFEVYDKWGDESQPTYVTMKRTSQYRQHQDGKRASNYKPVLCAECALLLGFEKVPLPEGGYRWQPPRR